MAKNRPSHLILVSDYCSQCMAADKFNNAQVEIFEEVTNLGTDDTGKDKQERYIKKLHALRSLTHLEHYFRHHQDPATKLDIKTFKEIIRQLIFDEVKQNYEKESIGQFAYLLIHHGSVKQQTFFAMAEWLVIAETTVKNSYYKYRDKEDKVPEDLKDYEDDLILSYSMSFLYNQKRPFPKSYPSAYTAFKNVLREALKDMLHSDMVKKWSKQFDQ